MLNLLTLFIAWAAWACYASDTVRILSLQWLTFGDNLLQNDDAYCSAAIMPIALKHFNQRQSSVIPALEQLKGKCNVTLAFTNGEMQDTNGLPNVAMSMFVKQYSKRSFDVVHVARSEIVQPIAVTSGALDYPVITHAGGSAIGNRDVYPTFFRTVTSDGYRTNLIARLLKHFNYRALGLIYMDDAYGTAFRAALQTSCTSANVRLVAAGFRAAATGTDLEDDVRRALKLIIDERIRVIYHVGVDNNFVYALTKAVFDLGWLEDRVFFANRPPGPGVVANAPDKEQVLRVLQGTFVVMSSNEHGNKQFEALMKLWPTLNVTEVNEAFPNITARNGASVKVPENYFREKEADARDFFRSWTLGYDAIMSFGLAACARQMNGNPPTESLVRYMAKLDFEGVSGRVRFDEQFNRLDDLHVLFNVQRVGPDGFRIVRVGSVIGQGNWTVDMQRIQFDDGTNILPIDIDPPPHQIDSLSRGAVIWGYIEASVAMGLSLVTLVYLVRHRNDQAFIESQPLFMFLLACGCFVMGLSIIGLVIETNAGCMLFPWLFTLGFTLSLSSLTAKSARVAVLWYSRGPIKQRNHSVRATVLLSGIALVLCGLIALLTVWQLLAPLKFVINTSKRDVYDFPLYSSAMCVAEQPLSITFLALVITYVCIVVFVTMWVSFWVRNAPEKFQETKMTAIAGVSMFQVFFVGIPTAVAVWNMALPRFLVLSSLTFLLCCIILFTMFLPKVMRERFGIEHSSDMNSQRDKRNEDFSPVPGDDAHPIIVQDKGVLTNRGKKRRHLENGSQEDADRYIQKRSIVERVLESVQEVQEGQSRRIFDEKDDSSSNPGHNQPSEASSLNHIVLT